MVVLCVLDVDVLLMRCGIFPLLFDKILIVVKACACQASGASDHG